MLHEIHCRILPLYDYALGKNIHFQVTSTFYLVTLPFHKQLKWLVILVTEN